MNWPKLHQDYPLAYAKMVKDFKCLYTAKLPSILLYDYNDFSSPVDTLVRSIKHPLKRDLYDFFDGVGIIARVGNGESNFFTFEIDCSEGVYDIDCKNMSRSQTETEAFKAAFEILNKRLEDETAN